MFVNGRTAIEGLTAAGASRWATGAVSPESWFRSHGPYRPPVADAIYVVQRWRVPASRPARDRGARAGFRTASGLGNLGLIGVNLHERPVGGLARLDQTSQD